MDHNQETPMELPDKLWTQDDPYRCTLPKPNTLSQRNDDIWENCLVPLQREDEKQCKAWREEVQNLLVFAGLFSAVVTTFVVDSYKNLLPSSDQRTVDLLSQIAARLDNVSTSFDTPSSSSFSPSQSSVRVNALWFMSLVISLTTALIGIVSLQWIAEYERYSGHWTPRQVFELRNMRHESMDRWFVPQIFVGLPLLLQGALILFLIGLMDFLLHLYPVAGLPTIGVVSITLFFLVITTILPTLQYYVTPQSQRLDIPTTPFPYKSPQSCYIGIIEMLVSSPLWPPSWLPVWTPSIADIPNLSNWNIFDSTWIDRRSLQVIPPHLGDHDVDPEGRKQIKYHYDTADGIAHVVSNYCLSNQVVALSAYHCFLELHKSTSALHHWTPQGRSRFYQCLELRDVFSYPDASEMCLSPDGILMTFLDMFQLHSSWIPGLSSMVYRQQIELWVRMNTALGHEYPQGENGNHIITRASVSICYLWNYSEVILSEDLALQLILLYKHLVTGIDNIGDGNLSLHHTGPSIAAVTAAMDSYSMPSFVRLRHLIEPLHVILAERILQSRTQADSEFAHILGYRFVEPRFCDLNRRNRGSLSEWSESYKEAFSFLVTAVCRTIDRNPMSLHHDVYVPRMRYFVENISPEMHNRMAKRFQNLTQEELSEVIESPDPQNVSLSGSQAALDNPSMDKHIDFPDCLADERCNAGHRSLPPGPCQPPLEGPPSRERGDSLIDVHPPDSPAM